MIRKNYEKAKSGYAIQQDAAVLRKIPALSIKKASGARTPWF
jgi:hypothetical protein